MKIDVEHSAPKPNISILKFVKIFNKTPLAVAHFQNMRFLLPYY